MAESWPSSSARTPRPTTASRACRAWWASSIAEPPDRRARRRSTPATERDLAFRVLMRVELDRAYADRALDAALERSRLGRGGGGRGAGGVDFGQASPARRRERALATEIAYGTLRLRARIDAALAQMLDRELGQLEPRLRTLLRMGTYQILFLGGVSDWAAVSESVDLARRVGLDRASGLVNAVLRQMVQQSESLQFPDLEDDPLAWLVQWGSLPEWLAERLLVELGVEEAAALAEALAAPAPRSIRVVHGQALKPLLRRLGGRPCRFAPHGLTELEHNPVSDPGFRRGEFTVQDEASQLVALLLGATRGATVVDCCAAPGGKALQLAEIVGAKGEVIALDAHGPRLPLIGAAARRLGIHNLRLLERDASRSFDLRGQQRFDGVLVDAPCSGLGVLRRNPDARWRLQPHDIPRAAELARRLLATAARYVRPGGALVYSVCTFSREETDDVIRDFLAGHSDYTLADPRPWLPEPAHALVEAPRWEGAGPVGEGDVPGAGADDAAGAGEAAASRRGAPPGSGGVLRTWPHRHGCDGFFSVRLERAAGPPARGRR
ncbi:MAG: transcription antitermination factor NusB [Myxococcota bacterium]